MMEVAQIIVKDNTMIAGRLLPDTDLIQELKKVCQQNNIKNGNVISCIGSLKKASYVYAIDDPDNIINIKYSEPVIVEGPLELITCQGTIGQENGETSIHLHGVFGDKHTNLYAGHISECENIILATVEFLIVGYDSPNINRLFDSQTGFNLLQYSEVKE